ncbi:MAG: type II toxin-antitoxin system HipA family toxin, partial [Acidimicrobiales bacterium]|nr:type II toxin-antitoxin system HipA family toxin [Acidimicrobiales bacterium]
MYDALVAHLDDTRSGLRLTYSAEALKRFAGWPLLSVSMPVERVTFRGVPVKTFFEGLLPEGEIRQIIAYDFSVPLDDTVGLLEVLGADCPGALVIVSEGVIPQAQGISESIDDISIAERLRKLPQEPLGVDKRVRLSLAGMQHKLLLGREAQGWTLAVNGMPSTHILKPSIAYLSDSVANEALCMRTAHHMGIDVAKVEIAHFEDIDTLIISRYDRVATPNGIERVHQEDFCQALKIPPQKKYESSGGPSLLACARELRHWVRGSEVLYELLNRCALNVVLGNADAHGKNLSILHHRSGRLSLAPAYDLMSTAFYGHTSLELAMSIGGESMINKVGISDLINEAKLWGLDPDSVKVRL